MISADLGSPNLVVQCVSAPGNAGLITRRSQVQILPPLWKGPGNGALLFSAQAQPARLLPNFARSASLPVRATGGSGRQELNERLVRGFSAALCAHHEGVHAELPSGTVTFVFTDIEGTTGLLHELGEEAYAEALGDHRQVIRERVHGRGEASRSTRRATPSSSRF